MVRIVSCTDPQNLYKSCADFVVDCCRRAVSRSNRCVLALSGGRTPRGLYEWLARDPYRLQLPRDQMHFFWADERYVPADHPESNFKLARETFLDPLSVPRANIHRVPIELGSPAAAALAYERDLRAFFPCSPGGEAAFDLILLGIGKDGHTASLFPGGPELNVRTSLVTSSRPAFSPPRITLTLRTINSARQVAFLVTGAEKAEVLPKVLEGQARFPAARVDPVHGSLTFFLDQEVWPGTHQ